MSEKQLSAEDILTNRLHYLFKKVKEAQRDFELVQNGDRILVALSGGKDSMALCHVLAHWQQFGKETFDLAALHVEVDGADENGPKREDLARALERTSMPLHFTRMDISEFRKTSSKLELNCYRCAWKRRKEIFVFAHEHGFNKVAFGHHFDDAVETILMNLLFHSNLQSMEPKVSFFEEAVTIIRPLILAEEREVIRVSSTIGFDYFTCICPEGNTTQRDEAKQYIRSFGKKSKMIKHNLWHASRTWIDAVGADYSGARLKAERKKMEQNEG